MALFAEDQRERRRSVASTRRLVYNWYEMHHNDQEVVDIYSPEWAKRIAEWQEWLFKTYHTIDVNPDIIEEQLHTPDQIDLPLLFFAYPIAAFSLWQILQACYDLDKAVCPGSAEKTEEWQSLRPFEYMGSKKVQQTWGDELKLLKKKIRVKLLTTGEIRLIIQTLFSGLERLDTAVRLATENFVDLDVEVQELMLEKLHDVLNRRCLMIAKILKVDRQEEMQEETDGNYETSGDSMHGSPTSSRIEAGTQLDEYIPELEERPLSTPTKGRRGSGLKRSLTDDQGEIKKRRQ